jgi:serine/threonine-protein kinase
MMGERLGRWILSREIGRGGMGHVHLAQEEVTGRRAAIKILSPELAQDVGFLQRFEREIETLAKLAHPNIVQFYDAGHDDGRYWYAMEFVEGRGLDDLIEHRRRFPWRDTIDVAFQICPALKHVHDHGIVHRDLKPSNILVRDDGILKLTDFGIAKIFASTQLTKTGGIVGSAEYISPEQAAGKPSTKRSDIYSLGVILYQMLTGRPPFAGDTFLDLLHKHRYAQFDRIRRIEPDVPHDLDDLISRMLDKDPAQRPPDCLVLHKQLEAIRMKIDRKEQTTHIPLGDTVAETKPTFAPDTAPVIDLVGDRSSAEGPIARFFNRPLVLIALMAACVGIVAYLKWPLDEETLYRRGAELMASTRLSDQEEAWHEYLEPLERRFPETSHKGDLDKFRRKRMLSRGPTGKASEAERFVRQAIDLREGGNVVAAAHLFKETIIAFEKDAAAKPWVEEAREQIAEMSSPAAQAERLTQVRPQLDRAAALKAQGKQEDAERLWSALEMLYQDDPAGGAIMEEIRAARQR